MGSCRYKASRVAVLQAFCALITILSLALPTLGLVTNPGCSADLSNEVTKFQTGNLQCKNYNFPTSNPYVIWVCSLSLIPYALQSVNITYFGNQYEDALWLNLSHKKFLNRFLIAI